MHTDIAFTAMQQGIFFALDLSDYTFIPASLHQDLMESYSFYSLASSCCNRIYQYDPASTSSSKALCDRPRLKMLKVWIRGNSYTTVRMRLAETMNKSGKSYLTFLFFSFICWLIRLPLQCLLICTSQLRYA